MGNTSSSRIVPTNDGENPIDKYVKEVKDYLDKVVIYNEKPNDTTKIEIPK